VRWAARTVAVAPAIGVMCLTGAAFAEAPESWEDPPPVAPLHALLILFVIPLGLFLLITLLVCLPSMRRGESYQPGQLWRAEPEWFGGPRRGLDAVDENESAAAGAGGTADTHPGRGGASGHW
jgi:hypothetical protein